MALLDEDLDPKRPEKGPKKLDTMSISELEDHIAAMRAEITRVEAEIERKRTRLAAAESFFKT